MVYLFMHDIISLPDKTSYMINVNISFFFCFIFISISGHQPWGSTSEDSFEGDADGNQQGRVLYYILSLRPYQYLHRKLPMATRRWLWLGKNPTSKHSLASIGSSAKRHWNGVSLTADSGPLRFHGFVCSLWLWYFLIILAYYIYMPTGKDTLYLVSSLVAFWPINAESSTFLTWSD